MHCSYPMNSARGVGKKKKRQKHKRMSFHPYPNDTEKNLWQKHSSHLLFKNSKFSTLSMQVLVSSHMEVEETSKGRKYKEQC